MTDTELTKVGDQADLNLSKYVIDLEDCGHLEVYVQGDLETGKNGDAVFMTIHGVGNSYKTWARFMNHEDMMDTKNRSLALHICLPGQGENDEDLTTNFPDMASLGMNLVTVLDQMRIPQVVVLGEGAGANIAARFASIHSSRVQGMLLINCKHAPSSFPAKLKMMLNADYGDNNLNMKNVAKYEAAYKDRDEILSMMSSKTNVDTILMCSSHNQQLVKAAEEIHSVLPIGLCSVIKVEAGGNVLIESPDKVADTFILFCQGLGLVPSVQRKISRSQSVNSAIASEEQDQEQESRPKNKPRKVSMEMFDIPNIRRLSLSSHNI